MPSSTLSCNRIISGFARNGHLENAKSLFDAMFDRDVVSWNSILGAYSRHGATSEAREVFGKMPATDGFSWSSMLSAFAHTASRDEVGELFDKLPVRELISWTSMLHSCARDGRLEEMQAVFWRFPCWDVICWNEVITACAREGHLSDALVAFNQMPGRSSVTWNLLLQAFCRASQPDGQVEEARRVFDAMLHRNTVSWNSMVAGYVRAGRVAEAKLLFDAMPDTAKRDVVSWNTMLPAFTVTEDAAVLELVEECFRRMPFTSQASWNAMLHAYACGGVTQRAEQLFERMPEKDSASWSALASARLLSGKCQSAASVVGLMDLDGCKPDAVSYISALEACGMASDLAQGRILHAEIVAADDPALQDGGKVATALVSMYSRCAALGEAVAAFDGMSSKNLVSWTAMVAALAQNGFSSLARLAFWRMELNGFTPDSISFISILSACNHAGSVELGWSHFVSMVGDYGIQPGLDHYACVVDLLGRAGNLEDAHELMDAMPFIPGPDSRTSLLSACRGLPVSKVPEFVPHEQELDGGEDVLFVGILAAAG
ncbi:hypothetical protein SELMODRAFT_135000 [Selaginella moellendorffii]|uniref:Pentacotripeptide-repeat region of PRORP domain-containing protein n=1 Tax=Selaginella moellendorffii TaxID=88036 RepID=D8T9J3_SELML|nr:hypothetical protein SELMODRAFT_135000 [Selaginella moellendorffii]